MVKVVSHSITVLGLVSFLHPLKLKGKVDHAPVLSMGGLEGVNLPDFRTVPPVSSPDNPLIAHED